MGVGTSDGKYFDDTFEMLAEQQLNRNESDLSPSPLRTGLQAKATELHDHMTAAYDHPQEKARYQTWPEKVARGLWDAFTLPHDVYQGTASDEDVGRVLGTAGLMFGAPMAMPTKEALASTLPSVAERAYSSSLENLGVNTFRREMGRDPVTSRFGRVPEDMGGASDIRFNSPSAHAELQNSEHLDATPAEMNHWDFTHSSNQYDLDRAVRGETPDHAVADNISAFDIGSKPIPMAAEATKTVGRKISEFKEISNTGLGRVFEFDAEGKKGVISLIDSSGGRGNGNLHVAWMGASHMTGGEGRVEPWSVGTAGVRDMLRRIKEEYPDAKSISGLRISGARAATGSGANRAVLRLR